MNVDFKIGQDTHLPWMTSTLKYGNTGVLISLTSGLGPVVTFSMRRAGYDTFKVSNALAEIVDAPNSHVRYKWQTGDTDTPGLYLGFWTVTYSDGTAVQVPNDAHINISVVAK